MSDALIQALMMGQRQRSSPLERQRAYADSLIKQGSSTAPVYSPLEGLARALQGGVGGYFAADAENRQAEKSKKGIDALSAAINAKSPEERANAIKGLDADSEYTAPMLGNILTQQISDERKAANGQTAMNTFASSYGAPPQGGPAPQQGGTGNAGQAISGIESGGRYDAVGPVANQQGNRAYGKYQVLDSNIPTWTQEVLGQPMSPQQFLANPQAQDAVFKAKFGQYQQKYGPEGASRAWFAGEGGMNNPNAKDVLGTTVQGYGNKFAQAYGPGATGGPPQGAPQVAQGSADPSGTPLPPSATALPQVPEIPRPQPTPQQIQKYTRLVGIPPEQGGMTPAQARQALDAELNQQHSDQKGTALLQFNQQQGQAKTADQRAYEAQEHDRREKSKPPTAEQSLSSGFSDRMTNSNRIIGSIPNDVSTDPGNRLAETMQGVGGNYLKSDKYQTYQQARDDFINAQLRRESGAAIGPHEYENANRQYFPQPGDAPAVLEQKAKNRALAVEGMVRNSGQSYTPSPTVNAPAAPAQAADPIAEARAAIGKGAPKDKVIERLRSMGLDPAGL